MAAKKPIIGAIMGDAANEIKKSNSGYTCDPGSSKKVSDLILKIYNHSNEERKSFGINGYNFVKQNRALGELDHPDSSVVNLANVSHNITEMHFEGDNLVGTCEILTTPSGNILKELFKNGEPIPQPTKNILDKENAERGPNLKFVIKNNSGDITIIFSCLELVLSNGSFR